MPSPYGPMVKVVGSSAQAIGVVWYVAGALYSDTIDRWRFRRLKVRTFIYRRLQGNQNSSGLQCEVAYWPALAVGIAAQLVSAHCPNERTLDPQSAATQAHLCHLATPEGWKAELA